jgi:hypothetical protein
MSSWDDERGWRDHLLCPLCNRPVWYKGHVDVTQLGDTGRSQMRGIYVCKTVGCDNYEQRIQEPRQR